MFVADLGDPEVFAAVKRDISGLAAAAGPNPRKIAELREYAVCGNEEICLIAVKGLGKIGAYDKETLALLERLANDKTQPVEIRMAAREVEDENFKRSWAEGIRQIKTNNSATVKVASIIELVDSGCKLPEFVECLGNAKKSNKEKVRDTAEWALSELNQHNRMHSATKLMTSGLSKDEISGAQAKLRR